MFESNSATSFDWTSFDFFISRVFEQSASVNNHLLCYWPTIHNLISKICPKLSEEHWLPLSKKLCKVKIIQIQSTFNVITCINKRFVVNNSGILCLAWYSTRATWIGEGQSCKQKIISRLLYTISHLLFSSVDQYKLMTHWLSEGLVSKVTSLHCWAQKGILGFGPTTRITQLRYNDQGSFICVLTLAKLHASTNKLY